MTITQQVSPLKEAGNVSEMSPWEEDRKQVQAQIGMFLETLKEELKEAIEDAEEFGRSDLHPDNINYMKETIYKGGRFFKPYFKDPVSIMENGAKAVLDENTVPCNLTLPEAQKRLVFLNLLATINDIIIPSTMEEMLDMLEFDLKALGALLVCSTHV